MKPKLCAICPKCGKEAPLNGRRIVRHTVYSSASVLPPVCPGTNGTATDDNVRAWLTRELKSTDNVSKYTKKLRADADNLRADADRLDAEAAALRTFVAAQLAKLGGTS